MLSAASSLRTLHLDRLGLHRGGARRVAAALAAALRAGARLAALSLSGNGVGDGACEELRHALAAPGCALLELDLGGAPLGYNAAQHILLGLIPNPRLCVLRADRPETADAAALDRYHRIHHYLKRNRDKRVASLRAAAEDTAHPDPDPHPHPHGRSTSDPHFPSAGPRAAAPGLHAQPLARRQPPVRRGGATPTPTPTPPKLVALFAAPLAWRDGLGRLRAMPLLDTEAERDVLCAVFREASRDVSIAFDTCSTSRLSFALSKGPRALHFSGHGLEDCLTFEDGRGGVHPISIPTLRGLILTGDPQRRLRFVSVSACHSRRAGEAFTEAGVPHVVCVNLGAALADAAARRFTRALYLGLAVGRTVQSAFDHAVQAVKAAPDVRDAAGEAGKFLLLPEGADHRVRIFPDARRVARWMGRPRALAPGRGARLPAPPEDFLGRETDLYRLLQRVLERRFVSLSGRAGVGKTALAAGLCAYVAERATSLMGGGVAYVALDELEGTGAAGAPPADFTAVLDARVRAELRRVADGAPKSGAAEAPADGDVLLVLDQAEALSDESAAELRLAIGRLLEEFRALHLLVVTADVSGGVGYGAYGGGRAGVAETRVSLEALTFQAALKLFARQCPLFQTGAERFRFVRAMLVHEGDGDRRSSSKDLSSQAQAVFEVLGNGNPGAIRSFAFQCDEGELEALRAMGGAA